MTSRRRTFSQSILLLISWSIIAALVGCSSGSNNSRGGGGGGATPSISLTTNPSPSPTSLVASTGTLSLTAILTNDSSGANWSAACGSTSSGACGTFSAANTASGIAVAYTAPSTVPPSSVVITASVADDASITASTGAITITAANSPSVSLSTAPTSLALGGTFSITATVTNDSGNGGVTWSCTSSNSAATCGSFSASKSASGTAVAYIAPSVAASVVITATVVDDASVTASTPTITVSSAPSITVTLSTPPPSSLAPGGTATIAATTNDTAGVTWSCTPTTTCGSFNPTSTLSTATTVFTSAATTGNIVITATSVSSTGVSASANVNLTTAASGALSQGNYAFWLAGWDENNTPYYVAGAFALVPGSGTSGTSGTVTGEQDFIDAVNILPDSLTGSYALTTDGNLQITLNTGDPNIGPSGNGVETLNATLTSGSSARIVEFDSWASGSGQLEPQSVPATTPLGGYAFSISGLDGNGNMSFGIGGVIDVDSSGGISGNNSVFDENDAGTVLLAQSLARNSSTVSPAPLDGFGRVIFNLTPSSASGVGTIALVGYFVDSSHVRLVETIGDTLNGTTGGQAFVQNGPTAVGSFSTSSFEGSSYVFGATGVDTANFFLQTAGVIAGNSDGRTVSGNISINDLIQITAQGGATIAAGTYTVDPTGRVTLSGVTDNNLFNYNLELYLDGNGHARVLSLDASDEVEGLAGLQKLPATPFNGTFAMGATGADPQFEDQLDAVGPLVSDASAGTLSGFADLNWLFNPTPPGPTLTAEPVSGTFASANGAGVSSGIVTGIDVTDCQVYNATTTTGCSADAFTYYLVNASTAVGIESDANQLTLIRFELQQ
jgi:hypothetical protein